MRRTLAVLLFALPAWPQNLSQLQWNDLTKFLRTHTTFEANGNLTIGGADQATTPGALFLSGGDRVAGVTDGSASAATFRGGQGTGTGNGGDVILQIAPRAASTGTTPNALQNAFLADADSGVLQIGGINHVATVGTPSHLQGRNAATGQTDQNGGILEIRGGQGTGTGASGTVSIHTAPPATSTGSTQNARAKQEQWFTSALADPEQKTATFFGSRGATWVRGSLSELLTLNAGSTTTDTTANLLPLNSIIESVVTRVTTTITTCTAFSVGDPTTAARFSASAGGLSAGNTRVGLQHHQGSVTTDAAGPVQTSAAKVRITCDANPGAGVIRIEVFYSQFSPPTS